MLGRLYRQWGVVGKAWGWENSMPWKKHTPPRHAGKVCCCMLQCPGTRREWEGGRREEIACWERRHVCYAVACGVNWETPLLCVQPAAGEGCLHIQVVMSSLKARCLMLGQAATGLWSPSQRHICGLGKSGIKQVCWEEKKLPQLFLAPKPGKKTGR